VILSCGQKACLSRLQPLVRALAASASQRLIEQIKGGANKHPVLIFRRLGIGHQRRIDRCGQSSVAIEVERRLSGDRLGLPERFDSVVHAGSLTTRLAALRVGRSRGLTRPTQNQSSPKRCGKSVPRAEPTYRLRVGSQDRDRIPGKAAETEGSPPGDDTPKADELEEVVASLTARSLASREIAQALSTSAAAAAPDEPPEALASLVLYVLEAASAFLDAEQALRAGKPRLEPEQARKLRRLLRLGYQALSEVGQLLDPESDRSRPAKPLVVVADDEPRAR
jgi:hypothetical protein